MVFQFNASKVEDDVVIVTVLAVGNVIAVRFIVRQWIGCSLFLHAIARSFSQLRYTAFSTKKTIANSAVPTIIASFL